MLCHESKFKPDSDSSIYEDVINYAQLIGRYPIYVYEPDMSDRLLQNFVNKYFDENEVHKVRGLKEETTMNKKVIYFNKYTTQWNQPIPLLISGQGMMHGGEKSMLIQEAEKVVYFATEVYNIHTLKNKK